MLGQRHWVCGNRRYTEGESARDTSEAEERRGGKERNGRRGFLCWGLRRSGLHFHYVSPDRFSHSCCTAQCLPDYSGSEHASQPTRTSGVSHVNTLLVFLLARNSFPLGTSLPGVGRTETGVEFVHFPSSTVDHFRRRLNPVVIPFAPSPHLYHR